MLLWALTPTVTSSWSLLGRRTQIVLSCFTEVDIAPGAWWRRVLPLSVQLLHTFLASSILLSLMHLKLDDITIGNSLETTSNWQKPRTVNTEKLCLLQFCSLYPPKWPWRVWYQAHLITISVSDNQVNYCCAPALIPLYLALDCYQLRKIQDRMNKNFIRVNQTPPCSMRHVFLMLAKSSERRLGRKKNRKGEINHLEIKVAKKVNATHKVLSANMIYRHVQTQPLPHLCQCKKTPNLKYLYL